MLTYCSTYKYLKKKYYLALSIDMGKYLSSAMLFVEIVNDVIHIQPPREISTNIWYRSTLNTYETFFKKQRQDGVLCLTEIREISHASCSQLVVLLNHKAEAKLES